MIKYCQNCSADLALSKANRCYKCGRLFDLHNPRTYHTSRHKSLYRPWYRFTRHPILWSGLAIATCLATVRVGAGIEPIAVRVYADLFDSLRTHIPTMVLLGLWAILLLPIALLRKPGVLRAALITTAPILFITAAVVAVVVNQILYSQIDGLPPAEYIIQGLAWPAICAWTIAYATGWHPILRTLPCLLVCGALIAYWYLRVFPPIAATHSTHPMTFVSSIPFFLSLLIPLSTWLWTLRPIPKPKAKSKTDPKPADKTPAPPKAPANK